MPEKYRDRYKEHGGSCGDELSIKLKQFLAAPDGGIDRPKLEALAKKNDCWKSTYSALDNGRARMTVGNSLRALVRRGAKLKWAALLFALLLAGGGDRVAAEPLPVPKQGQCPSGYSSGAAYCTPMANTSRDAVPKVGQCPSNWVQSGAYCLSPPRGRR